MPENTNIKKRSITSIILILLIIFSSSTCYAHTEISDEGYPILNETESALAQKVMSLELSVRTVKTHNKNIKVIVNQTDELKELVKEAQKAGYWIYYKYCRSVRKSSKYITWRTTPETTYINTEGIAGKRYYYKVRVILYGKLDGDSSYVTFINLAESELKQCRYGVRIWTKN